MVETVNSKQKVQLLNSKPQTEPVSQTLKATSSPSQLINAQNYKSKVDKQFSIHSIHSNMYNFNYGEWKHLCGLKLADLRFLELGNGDILDLGAGDFSKLLLTLVKT